ncbi:unnamed protein product [Clavelina lepadiformis]|uniref:Uncharacterized protein n=1 Tax=Clavelina lepadiformis TaxID=159417 RepID=A0ABP0FS09_CLALP
METDGHSTLSEINSIIHWFRSWSPRQREQFMEELIEKALPNKVDVLAGALDGMNMRDRAPSIFQCQLRLFRQWFDKWTLNERNFMVERLESCDQQFVEEFYDRVRRSANVS